MRIYIHYSAEIRREGILALWKRDRQKHVQIKIVARTLTSH